MYRNSFKVLNVYHVQGPVPGVSAEGSTVRLCLRGGLFSLGRGKVKSLWAQRTERSHQPEGTPGKAVRVFKTGQDFAQPEYEERALLEQRMLNWEVWISFSKRRAFGEHVRSLKIKPVSHHMVNSKGRGWKFGRRVLAALTAPMKRWWSGMMVVDTPQSDGWSYT